MAELWGSSIESTHIQGGFKSAGLLPLDRNAIAVERLSPSLDIVSESPPSSQEEKIEFSGSGLLRCGSKQTPIRVELRAFFVRALRPADGEKRVRRRRRVELGTCGEVLTQDEVFERLEKADLEKEKKKEKAAKKGKKKSSGSKGQNTQSEDNVQCSKCGQPYTESEAEDWIGCDLCDSWWHYWCAGLNSMLTEEEEWFCEQHE